jgi:hypothetical protein
MSVSVSFYFSYSTIRFSSCERRTLFDVLRVYCATTPLVDVRKLDYAAPFCVQLIGMYSPPSFPLLLLLTAAAVEQNTLLIGDGEREVLFSCSLSERGWRVRFELECTSCFVFVFSINRYYLLLYDYLKTLHSDTKEKSTYIQPCAWEELRKSLPLSWFVGGNVLPTLLSVFVKREAEPVFCIILGEGV